MQSAFQEPLVLDVYIRRFTDVSVVEDVSSVLVGKFEQLVYQPERAKRMRNGFIHLEMRSHYSSL